MTTWDHFLFTLCIVCLSACSPAHAQARNLSVLLFTKTAGYRHESIPTAVDVITKLGTGDIPPPQQYSAPSTRNVRWTTVHSEDGDKFEDDSYLRQFAAVVFAFTTDADPPKTGSLLSHDGALNLLQYIQQGGNFVGIHSATNTLYDYPAYGRLVGGFFSYHAQSQNVTLEPVSRTHPAVARLPDSFSIKEEMYHLRSSPLSLPSQTEVLLTNSTPYSDPGGIHNEGTPQPLSWSRSGSLLTANDTLPAASNLTGDNRFTGGDGRAWLTTLGHELDTWSSDIMRGHIHGGIAWTLQSATANWTGNAASGSSTSSSNNATTFHDTSEALSSRGGLPALYVAIVASYFVYLCATL